MKQHKKRIFGILLSLALSLVLALAMVFSTFAMVQTAYAGTEEGTPGMVEGSDILGDYVNTADARTVYYAGTAWRVIGYGGQGVASETNTMTLISAGNLKTDVQFRADWLASDANHYSKSNLKKEMDTVSGTFSAGEKSGIAARDLASGDYNGQDTDCIAGDEVKGALLWPLSTKEANAMNGDLRRLDGGSGRNLATDFWWLRSPGFNSTHAFQVWGGGEVSDSGRVAGKYGVRPALNLNLSSALFTSAAVGGKSSGTVGNNSLKPVGSNDSGEWKLTLKDDGTITGLDGHMGFTASRADSGNVVAGGNIKITYNGGQTGTNEYVSVFLKDSTGKIVYYGHLAENSESATGAALTIPSDIALGTYTVGVFAEQCNGDNNTDYASAISTFDITVVTHTHEFTYAAGTGEDADTITATCTASGCPLPGSKTTLKIVKPARTVYGGSESAEATFEGEIPSVTPTAKYYKGTEELSAAPTNVGTYKAQVTLKGSDEKEATAFVEYTIAKADISPVVNIEGWDYGDTPNEPSVTAESNPGGGADTYEYYTDEACTQKTTSAQGATGEGGVPSFGGDYWVKATVAETDNYKSGTGTKKFTINATAITATGLKGDTKVYDGTTSATLDVTGATLDGVKSGDEVRIASATGTFDNKNVDTDKTISSITIVLTGKDAGGYKATADPVTGAITAKAVKVTGITASNKIYDGNTTATLTFTGASLEGKVPGDTLSVKGKESQTGTFDGKNVGTGKTVTLPELALDGTDAGNYSIKDDSQTTATADITKKEVKVTAENKSKTFGEEDPELTYTADTLIGTDEYTGTLTREEGEDAGEYDIIQGSLSAGDNYEIKFTSAVLTIKRKDAKDLTPTEKEGEHLAYDDGKPQKPTIVIHDDETGKDLEEGKDFNIIKYVGVEPTSYGPNEEPPTEPGTYEAIIEFTGNYKGDPENPKKVPFTVDKGKQDPPTNLKSSPVSTDTAKDGKITGVDDTMEYSTDGGKTWTPVPEGAKSIDGLGKGTVQVRYKETDVRKAGKPAIIKIDTKPANVLMAQMTASGKKAMTIRWTKVNGADGYDIFFSKCNSGGKHYEPKLIKTVKGNRTFKWTKKGLKKSIAYKGYVRAYKMQGGKKKYISKSLMYHGFTAGYKGRYTDAKSVSVKKAAVSLKKGKTFTIKASIKKVKPKKILILTSHAPRLRYVSGNPFVAKVNGKGVITAKNPGTCYVYAVATNGVRKGVKVTVK